jgi:hypothetical protein
MIAASISHYIAELNSGLSTLLGCAIATIFVICIILIGDSLNMNQHDDLDYQSTLLKITVLISGVALIYAMYFGYNMSVIL